MAIRAEAVAISGRHLVLRMDRRAGRLVNSGHRKTGDRKVPRGSSCAAIRGALLTRKGQKGNFARLRPMVREIDVARARRRAADLAAVQGPAGQVHHPMFCLLCAWQVKRCRRMARRGASACIAIRK